MNCLTLGNISCSYVGQPIIRAGASSTSVNASMCGWCERSKATGWPLASWMPSVMAWTSWAVIPYMEPVAMTIFLV